MREWASINLTSRGATLARSREGAVKHVHEATQPLAPWDPPPDPHCLARRVRWTLGGWTLIGPWREDHG